MNPNLYPQLKMFSAVLKRKIVSDMQNQTCLMAMLKTWMQANFTSLITSGNNWENYRIFLLMLAIFSIALNAI